MKINIPLLALAIGAFGIGVTEFSPMGMLPIIASDLSVSIPTAGLLISAYAFGVLIGAPFMILSSRICLVETYFYYQWGFLRSVI
mgnify:CR=1 FL=1